MKTRTVWKLARMAECSDPDKSSSPGADFLRAIESSVKEAIEYEPELATDEDWQRDQAGIIADSCVPIYTHNLWTTFVDLCAYSEDVSDLGYEFSAGETERLPQITLYMIGERLALALFSDETSEEGTE